VVAATHQSLTQKYRIDASDQTTRLSWVGLSDEDFALLRKAGEFLIPEAETIAREFYDHSFKFPAFVAKVSEAGSNRQALEGAQAAYFKEILEGRADSSHMERALFIGENHTKLDVKPRWVIGNYATYAQLVFPRLAQHFEGEELIKVILAFSKMFSLDGSLLIEAYMGGLMDRMVGVYEKLGPSAVQLAEGSEQMSSAASEIAQAIQGVATSASEQTASVNNANVATEGMQSALSSVAGASTTAAEKSQDSMTAAEEGKQAADETAEAMRAINEAVVSTSGQIEELNESGKEIGAITETISEIADQTNLLALNAAIEAARAGDMGRGFAVVADEVRSLAERSSSAAKDIAALIEKVQTGVGRSVTAMNAVVTDVEGGAEKARQAGAVLERIVVSSEELGSEIRTIEDSTGQADGAANELAANMQQVGALADSNAASSEQVSASAEEVTAQVSEMNAQAEALSTLVGELAEFLSWIGAIDAAQAQRSGAAA
jgi:methyl-accepting chemotaxis protein